MMDCFPRLRLKQVAISQVWTLLVLPAHSQYSAQENAKKVVRLDIEVLPRVGPTALATQLCSKLLLHAVHEQDEA